MTFYDIIPIYLSFMAQEFADSAYSLIKTVLPIALPVMGAIAVIGIGVKVFKRFVK